MAKEKAKVQEKEATVEFIKIDTCTRKTIFDSLLVGQIVRNGGGRIFEIAGLDETQIHLKPLNDDKGRTGRILTMGRKVFADLYYLKNYDQVRSYANVRKEIMDAKATGADRFLL
jgi:hypothetical protein